MPGTRWESTVKVHDAVARTIADHGVRTLFGLMGDANMLYITDFITRHQGRFVPAADERNSVLMAGGYAAAGDVIGVATVTHGPALTNAVTPLVEVTRGRLPVVLVTGDTPANRDHLQRIDMPIDGHPRPEVIDHPQELVDVLGNACLTG